MNERCFTIQGEPATAGSKKAFPFRRKDGSLGSRVVDASGKKGVKWRRAVQEAYRNAFPDLDLMSCPVRLEIAFYFARPKCHYGTGRNADRMKGSAPCYHTKTPDLTKLTRALEDALTGLAWKDDSQVVSQITDKGYCSKHTPSHAVVTITEA